MVDFLPYLKHFTSNLVRNIDIICFNTSSQSRSLAKFIILAMDAEQRHHNTFRMDSIGVIACRNSNRISRFYFCRVMEDGCFFVFAATSGQFLHRFAINDDLLLLSTSSVCLGTANILRFLLASFYSCLLILSFVQVCLDQ